MHRLVWYFDFISPFSYLQWCTLRELPEFEAAQLRPVLFAALLKHWQHKGPAEIPGKRRFTYRHVLWLAEQYGIALRFPPAHPFNPVRALRLAVALEAQHKVVNTLFRFIWEEGRDPNNAIEWNVVQTRLGMIDGDALVSAPRVKERLRANGEEAIAAGVFGVPTLLVDGELFWGFDATDMGLAYLREPERFDRGEYPRVSTLPVAAARREVA